MEKSFIRYVFFEDLNFGWVVSQSQYHTMEVMAEKSDFIDELLLDRKFRDLLFV